MMNLLLLLTTLTWAQSPAPAANSDTSATTAITIDAKTEPYVLLRSGASADFDTPGPRKIVVNARRRMAGAAQRSSKAVLNAYGDGRLIMTIQVPGVSIPGGRIDDRLAGYPSKEERVVITVPEAGKLLRLEAPAGGPDFFVQVSAKDTPEALLLPLTSGGIAAAAPQTIEEAPEPIIEEETESSNPPADEPVRREPAPPRSQASASLDPGAGLSMGMGIPARGNKMVVHIGATGRYPIYKKLLSAGGTIGWYRIGVEEDVAVADTYGGALTYAADWHTNVVPIVAHVTAHAPTEFGPVVPIATAGLGLYIATRHDGGEKITSVAVGPEIAAGAEFDVQVGRLQTTVSWNEARSRFGNRGPEGDVVRETLAVTRLNLSYLYVF